MSSELPFKIAFLAAFICAALTATVAARRAVRIHGGSLNQLVHEVRGLIAVRATLGIIFYGALGAWLFASDRLNWAYLPIPRSARWAGVFLMAGTLILFMWSFQALGHNYRGGVGLYENHRLVTQGPYRVVRHPIYLGFVTLMLLLLLISTNWVLAASGVILVSSIAVARVPIEERELLDRFGATWEAYQRCTGCFFPRIGRKVAI